MADSAHKVLHDITQAGLLSSDQVTKFDRVVETGTDALLNKLIEEGHITSYQADKFRLGLSSDICFGDYLVMDKLGQGGMGTVLLAKHRRMDRKVAIKVLPVTTLESEASVARFYQEVKVAGQLTHPNIVHAYDAGEQNGFHYLVMEYVPGHDLARVQQELGPLPPALAIDYILQAAHGLDYAHRKGVVHRDIKPSNLLLDNEGVIKILDMGLARIGGQTVGDSNVSMHLTTTGQVMGTVDYMSPEQAEDTRLADARSDIYSLGCTLYRLLTAKSLFARDTVVKTILAHREAPLPDLGRDLRGLIDDRIVPEFDRVLKKMIAKRPADRYQTTGALLEDLRRLQVQLESGPETSTSSSFSPVRRGASPDAATIAPYSSSAVLPPVVPPSASSVDSSNSDHDHPGPVYTAPGYVPRSSSTPVQFPQPGSSRPEIAFRSDSVSSSPHAPEMPPAAPSDPNVIPRYGSMIPKGFIAPVSHGYPLCKQHRGKTILLMGIISLLLSSCLIGGIGGIITWVCANADLAEMDNGLRNPAGRNKTKAGQILGMISVGIAGVVFLGSLIRGTF
jgi:serine/threonine protein kinase